jgi:hypothetical protein
MPRTEKRGVLWSGMGRLQELGLGRREIVSDQRDKFVLDPRHPASGRLTTQLHSDGFIRADRGSLLFRHASQGLRGAVPAGIRAKAMKSDKGLEFRWTRLDNDELRSLMAVVELFAGGRTDSNQK